jgi:hypothetical protein
LINNIAALPAIAAPTPRQVIAITKFVSANKLSRHFDKYFRKKRHVTAIILLKLIVGPIPLIIYRTRGMVFQASSQALISMLASRA